MFKACAKCIYYTEPTRGSVRYNCHMSFIELRYASGKIEQTAHYFDSPDFQVPDDCLYHLECVLEHGAKDEA